MENQEIQNANTLKATTTLNNQQQSNLNETTSSIQEEITSLIELAKSTKFNTMDLFEVGSYCDAVDETKKWCVAEIIERKGENVTVHFEGWSDKHNETISIKRNTKIAFFRRYSKLYTGQSKSAFRKNCLVEEDFSKIKEWIKKIIDSNFECFDTAYQVTQILRGKIFTYIDIFMTSNNNSIGNFSISNNPKFIPIIVDILYDYIDLIICYYNYYIKHAYLHDALSKYPDLYLINKKCAIIAAFPEVNMTLRRILGQDNRVNEFYRNNDNIIKKIKPKASQRFCNDNYYKQSLEKDGYSIICVINFIDYLYSKGVMKLISDAVILQREEQSYFQTENTSIIKKKRQASNNNSSKSIPSSSTISKIQTLYTSTSNTNDTSTSNAANTARNILKTSITDLNKSNNIQTISSNINNTTIIDSNNNNNVNNASLSSNKFPAIELEFKVPIYVLSSFLTILLDCEQFLSKKLGLETEYFKIQEVIKQRLNFLTSLELKESKKFYINNISTIIKTLISSYDKKQASVIYEEIVLIYYWKCLTSRVLAKRITGINCITNVIEAIEKRERREFTANSKKTEEEVIFENTNSTILSKFFNDRKIIDYLLGESIHEEILKKSLPVFRFLINNKSFPSYYFDLLWKQYSEKHEAISKPIEVLICEMSVFLDIDEKQLLFEKIKSHYKENNSYIELVTKYTISCLRNIKITASSDDSLYFGLPLIWNIICSGNNKEIIETSIEKFSDIFFKLNSLDDSVKEKYLKYCFDNIASNVAVVPSLKTVQKLVSDLIEGSKSNKSIKRILKNCDDQFKVCNLLATEMIKYQQSVKTIQQSSIGRNENEDGYKDIEKEKPLTIIYEGLYTHQENITTRLNILNYLISEKPNAYKFNYTYTLIDSLWSIFVMESNFEEEKQVFFKFLIDISNESFFIQDSFINTISDHLFKNILCNKLKFRIDSQNFCIISFELFRKIFTYLNQGYNNLFEDIVLQLRVASQSLIGIETLIEIICEARNDIIKKLASNFLVNMTLNLHTYSEDYSKKYWTNLITNIVNIFYSHIQDKEDSSIKGLLMYFKQLLKEVDNPGNIPDQSLVNFSSEGTDVKFFYPKQGHSRTSRVSSRDRVMDVRVRMAYFYDIPYKKCVITTTKRVIDINDDYKIFREIVNSSEVLEINERDPPITKLKVNPKTMLLNNQDLFNTLYGLLLNHNHEYISDCYYLIKLFPISKKIDNDVMSCLFMEKMLLTPSIYLLNYNLKLFLNKLANNIVANKNSSGSISNSMSSRKEKSNNSVVSFNTADWVKTFIDKKGMDYLIQILKELKIDDNYLVFNTITSLLSLIISIYEATKEKQLSNKSLTKSIKSNKDIISTPSNTFLSKYIEPKILNLILISKLHSLINHCIDYDKNSKLITYQEQYMKRREKTIIRTNPSDVESSLLTYSNNQSIQSSLLEAWEEQNETFNSIFLIFETFCDKTLLINNILENNHHNHNNLNIINSVNDNSDVNNYNFSIMSKLLLESILNAYLLIKNYKIKESFSKFIMELIKFNNNSSDISNNLSSTCSSSLSPSSLKDYILTELLKKEILIDMVNDNLVNADKFLIELNSIIESCLEIDTSSEILYLSLDNSVRIMIEFIEKFRFNIRSRKMSLIIEGYLNLIRSIVVKTSKIKENVLKEIDVLDLLLRKCILSKCQSKFIVNFINMIVLVDPLKEAFPKCYGSRCVNAAYELLIFFSLNNIELSSKICEELTQYFNTGFWKGKKYIDWKIDNKQDIKSLTEYTGLINLSCTCYMNSLLQQFFCIPSIRESILVAKEFENSDKKLTLSNNSSLFQLKCIFASLKAYEAKAYNPKDFCLNFENQALSITEQMDVDEFFNMIVDKLEPQLKDSKVDNPFTYEFGGTFSNDVICQGCPHKSERVEGFNCIILSVKDNIQEALKNYVTGELLEGDNAFYCEKCDKKVNAVKRACIKTLPRTLILVLKRFEFDYDTLQKFKLNNYCEISDELNMYPYLQEHFNQEENNNNKNNEGYLNEEKIASQININNINNNDKPKDFYLYDLSGAIIHTGTAENGHYYSIIKTNNENIKEEYNTSWLEFNDSNVKPYDYKEDFANEAFGGSETIVNKDNNKEVVEKTTSAYVLFYKRRIQETSELLKYQKIYENKYIEEIVTKANEYMTDLNKNYSALQCFNISQSLLDKVNEDNFKYWVSKNLFNEEFLKFSVGFILENNRDVFLNQSNTRNKNLDYFIYSNKHIFEGYSINNNTNNDSNKDNRSSSDNSNVLLSVLSTRINSDSDSNINNYLSQLNNNTTKTINNSNDSICNKENSYFQFACLVNFNIVLRSKNFTYVPIFTDILKTLINHNENNAVFLLEEFSCAENLNEYLIDNPILEIRSLIIGLLNCSMIKYFETTVVPNILSNNSNDSFGCLRNNMFKNILCKMINSVICIINKYTFIDTKESKDLTHVHAILFKFSQLGNNYSECVLNSTNNTNFNSSVNRSNNNSFNSILHLYSKLYLVEIKYFDYLIDYHLLINPKYNYSKNDNCNLKIQELAKELNSISNTLDVLNTHKILSTKLMNKTDKLTNLEEGIEKKNQEKLQYSRHENYSYSTLLEVLLTVKLDKPSNNNSNKRNSSSTINTIACSNTTDTTNINTNNNTNINTNTDIISNIQDNKLLLPFSLLKKLDITYNPFLHNLLLEAKTRTSEIQVTNFIIAISTNNIINTSLIIDTFKTLLNDLDFNELEIIMRIIKSFLMINDSLTNKRIKDFAIKYNDVIQDNTFYYRFTDYQIDFLIKNFSSKKLLFQNLEIFKPVFSRLLKWLKENPYPPQLTPSKNCQLYKKKASSFPNNLNQQVFNNFINRQQQINNDKQFRISELFKKNNNVVEKDYDSDMDLSDFKFSIGDNVRFEGINAIVVKVLDELILIEFSKQEIMNTKRPDSVWVDTENKNLELVNVFIK